MSTNTKGLNPLQQAFINLNDASLEDLTALDPGERACLSGLLRRWADMAGYLDTQEIADHVADLQEQGLAPNNHPPRNH